MSGQRRVFLDSIARAPRAASYSIRENPLHSSTTTNLPHKKRPTSTGSSQPASQPRQKRRKRKYRLQWRSCMYVRALSNPSCHPAAIRCSSRSSGSCGKGKSQPSNPKKNPKKKVAAARYRESPFLRALLPTYPVVCAKGVMERHRT